MAVLSSTGYIDDFSFDGPPNATFPKLQQGSRDTQGDSPLKSKWPYKHFGASYKDTVYLIPANPNIKVSKLFVDEGIDSHVFIPDSKIPTSHIGAYVQGTQANNNMNLQKVTRLMTSTNNIFITASKYF